VARTFQTRVADRQSGQALVEFALVTFFIFLLFVSMVQMIMLMYAYNTLADSAKEGVRYAIVHGTQNGNCSGPGDPTQTPAKTCTDALGANVQAAVINFAAVSIQNVSTSEVTVSWNPQDQNGVCANGTCTKGSGSPPPANPGCSAPGCIVRVSIGHPYTPLFGLPWPNFTLYASAEGTIMN
jgi:Flp pilus assembly protein TadG